MTESQCDKEETQVIPPITRTSLSANDAEDEGDAEDEDEFGPHIDLAEFFNNSFNSDYIPWTNGGYKIYFNIRRFFHSPNSKKDLNILEQVENLLSSTISEEPSSEVIGKCRDFIKIHRIIENTSARKRLEKWATKLIVCYLVLVLILVITNSLEYIVISEAIMITILSTTTVNIIGLGLIVLRGHFYTKDEDLREKKDSKEN